MLTSMCAISAMSFATDYVVTSTNDSGPGTLREALGLFEVGDTISFDSMLSGTITLASDLPPIPFDTNIIGPDSLAVTIDGNSAYQIFEVSNYVTITNLVLDNVKTSVAGGAILLNDAGVLTLDQLTIPHCETACQAPVKISSNSALVMNNVTFSNPGSTGVDVLFEQDGWGIFGCDMSVQPQIWVDTTGSTVLYKEGEGTMEIKAANSIDLLVIADVGTLIFADTTTELMLALSGGTLSGPSSSNFIANMGLVNAGEDFGTITNDTDYYQTTEANLVVKIDGDANTDLLYATNAGYLSGNLIIQLAPGEYTSSTAYTLLTCNDGFTTPFDNAYFNIPGEGLQSITNASLSYTADSVILTITSDFTVNAPMSFAAAAKKPKYPPVKMATTPVNDMYNWIMKHKKKPKENVQKVLKNYTKELQKKVKKIKK